MGSNEKLSFILQVFSILVVFEDQIELINRGTDLILFCRKHRVINYHLYLLTTAGWNQGNGKLYSLGN
jgi:hypothetical protein